MTPSTLQIHVVLCVCYEHGAKIMEEYAAATAKSLQSCPTLCNPIDGSPPGSPIPGILQARTLEWVAMSSRKNMQFQAITMTYRESKF